MSVDAEDDMDMKSEEMDARKSPSEEIRQGMRRLSVSPPRQRSQEEDESLPPTSSSAWRSSTPPPPPVMMRPRVETPTATAPTGMPRTLSSPSLVDSSPMPAKKSPVATAPQYYSPATFARKGATTRHNELTPIARNTGGNFVDEGHVVVSPEDATLLHGEVLEDDSAPAITHVAFSSTQGLKRRSSGGTAPSLPPLQKPERAKSMGNMVADQQQEQEDEFSEPVKFPSDRKYCHYSFTSQQQFASTTTCAAANEYHPNAGLVPYQPTREDGNVGSFSGEVLGGIFQDGVPLEDRQYSIPSIHLAHHLNGSTTSYTDEEDDLLQRTFDDEASLSSRGSSLYLPGEEVAGEAIGGESGMASASKPLRLNVSAAKMAFRQGTAEEAAAAPAFKPPPANNEDSDNDTDEDEENRASKSRVKKRTKRKKERQAIEWLRSVESTNEDISEAASSKFLTYGTQVPINRRRSYHRNTSSPLDEQLSGAFPPPSDTFPPPTH